MSNPLSADELDREIADVLYGLAEECGVMNKDIDIEIQRFKQLLRRFGEEVIATPLPQKLGHWTLHPDQELRAEQRARLAELLGKEKA